MKHFLILAALGCVFACVIGSTDVVCPDKKTSCEDKTTCCLISDGSYGCCPYENATCCPDHLHCCPSSFKCDLSTQRCIQGYDIAEMLPKMPAKQLEDSNVKNIRCKDGNQCLNDQTCCQLNNTSSYGCCAHKNAVCCKGSSMCCPQNTVCDIKNNVCRKKTLSLAILQTQRLQVGRPIVIEQAQVQCADGKSVCPDKTTCCLMNNGDWGCCPMTEAVCCDDKVHCCPKDNKCVPEACQHTYTLKKSPLQQKYPASPRVVEADPVMCSDNTTYCVAGQTCCKLTSGAMGCCPLPKAVCCSDDMCCPEGTLCDLKNHRCNKKLGDDSEKSTPMRGALLAIPIEVESLEKPIDDPLELNAPLEKFVFGSVQCPDGKSQCPDDNTCCLLASGQWGCCPMPKAVCCADKVHCCPSGTTCGQGRCVKSDWTSVPLSKKVPAQPIPSAQSVACPDGKSECPNGMTCCLLKNGQYGCCPLPKAVCCADKQHCCPTGSTCGQGKCNKGAGEESAPFSVKIAATLISDKPKSVACPDGASQCPDGMTCCKLANGQYGCCPLPKAVCCADHVHCCPTGTTCGQGKCNKADGFASLPMELVQKPVLQQFQGRPSPPLGLVNIIAADERDCGSYSCPLKGSCCIIDQTCCPHENGVCCKKGHCCAETERCSEFGCTAGKLVDRAYHKPTKYEHMP